MKYKRIQDITKEEATAIHTFLSGDITEQSFCDMVVKYELG